MHFFHNDIGIQHDSGTCIAAAQLASQANEDNGHARVTLSLGHCAVLQQCALMSHELISSPVHASVVDSGWTHHDVYHVQYMHLPPVSDVS